MISDDDLKEIEKVVGYIREGKYSNLWNQVSRIERICKRIRDSNREFNPDYDVAEQTQ
jgi:hypothetical protein